MYERCFLWKMRPNYYCFPMFSYYVMSHIHIGDGLLGQGTGCRSTPPKFGAWQYNPFIAKNPSPKPSRLFCVTIAPSFFLLVNNQILFYRGKVCSKQERWEEIELGAEEIFWGQTSFICRKCNTAESKTAALSSYFITIPLSRLSSLQVCTITANLFPKANLSNLINR